MAGWEFEDFGVGNLSEDPINFVSKFSLFVLVLEEHEETAIGGNNGCWGEILFEDVKFKDPGRMVDKFEAELPFKRLLFSCDFLEILGNFLLFPVLLYFLVDFLLPTFVPPKLEKFIPKCGVNDIKAALSNPATAPPKIFWF